MIIKIFKTAHKATRRHDVNPRSWNHDGIVVDVIQQMRKFGMRLIDYDETPGNIPTVMKFEER